ncbi:MAG: glycosyltransferase family 39 protein [Gammaproteobacteria bacterium]
MRLFDALCQPRGFIVLFIVTLLIKLVFAAVLPMTGDEAYFIEWGKHPDFGYYDHPPMVGWFLTGLLAVSDAAWWLRLPTVLITSLIAYMIMRLLRSDHPQVAYGVAALYLLTPVNLVAMLMTTDTPLILWSFLSAVSFYLAVKHADWRWYLLCGVLLGAAFFSKFFAGLLGIAYAIYLVLLSPRTCRPWLGLALIILGTLPFVALNLYWNYTHCWNNYLFNLINRTADGNFSLVTVLKYLAWLLYLFTPPVLFYFVKHQRQVRGLFRGQGLAVFMALFWIPILLFLLLSTWKSIGLHWLMSFYAFAMLALGLFVTPQQLKTALKFMLPYAVFHVVLIAWLLAQIPELFRENENTYKDLLYATHTEELLEAVAPYQGDYALATDSYAESAQLAYASRQPVMAFGFGSQHARQNEQHVDMRDYAGGNIMILSYFDEIKIYAPYFEEFIITPVPIEGTTFYLGLGKGLRYELYRDEVLQQVRERYYRIPAWLPVGQCYFHERYFQEGHRD